MRRGHQEQLAAVTLGVSGRPLRVTSAVYHLSTLRHFDSKHSRVGQNGPIIPCERRLAKVEISENQEVTFDTRFGNRDYDRPFDTFLSTLCGFD